MWCEYQKWFLHPERDFIFYINGELADYYYQKGGDYEGAIENTAKIADMCAFDFVFGEIKLPRYRPENGMKPEEFLPLMR